MTATRLLWLRGRPPARQGEAAIVPHPKSIARGVGLSAVLAALCKLAMADALAGIDPAIDGDGCALAASSPCFFCGS